MIIFVLCAFLHYGLTFPSGENTQAAQETNPETSQNSTSHELYKRDKDCPMPSDLPERLDQLNPELNLSQIVASTKQEALYPHEFKNLKCPTGYGGWWPIFTSYHNLESMCPWEHVVRELGDEYYPSKIYEAQCLCAHCIHANANSCYKVRAPLLVFKRLRCNHGVAIMEKDEVMYTTGCQCISNYVHNSDVPVTE
ncbi:uncharacterized protein LOC131940245 [Physella acuta]|uniref:uncharacterized protein LOC131940245 n=1 Tax=Physella acuta TaxID=109671 RepID=UPI0027DC91A6|nr:uncharacterized protein LOC131940245 [Physella acuta]